MDIPNAFIGHAGKPTAPELSSVLGPTAELWNQFVAGLATDLGVTEQEWTSFSAKYGWALRLKYKKRTIVYLSPCSGCFRAAFILGAKAVKAARSSALSNDVVKAIEEVPRYAEGTGVRLVVKGTGDLAGPRNLAAIKLAN